MKSMSPEELKRIFKSADPKDFLKISQDHKKNLKDPKFLVAILRALIDLVEEQKIQKQTLDPQFVEFVHQAINHTLSRTQKDQILIYFKFLGHTKNFKRGHESVVNVSKRAAALCCQYAFFELTDMICSMEKIGAIQDFLKEDWLESAEKFLKETPEQVDHINLRKTLRAMKSLGIEKQDFISACFRFLYLKLELMDFSNLIDCLTIYSEYSRQDENYLKQWHMKASLWVPHLNKVDLLKALTIAAQVKTGDRGNFIRLWILRAMGLIGDFTKEDALQSIQLLEGIGADPNRYQFLRNI